jgi:hypothetical protein
MRPLADGIEVVEGANNMNERDRIVLRHSFYTVLGMVTSIVYALLADRSGRLTGIIFVALVYFLIIVIPIYKHRGKPEI